MLKLRKYKSEPAFWFAEVAKEFAVDALHHAVYAIVAGLVFDALSND